MKILRWLLGALAALCLVIAAGLGVAWIATAPEGLPAGTESASRLMPGPHPVGHAELQWVDPSRETPPNGDFPGSPHRRFAVSVWFPEGAGGEHPLLVYSHGFMSTRHGCAYSAEHLASHGYVVISADFPLTHFGAPGGPNFRDVVNQPADVSFLIDRVLALRASERPFEGEIDPERIGAFGLSLGGATTTLVAFHPEWRDPRIAAAISIAGPADIFTSRFFDNASVPFLMIAGTADAIVDYERNALPIPDRARRSALLSIEGATHAGFADVTAGILRVFGNPDSFGCSALTVDVIDPPTSNPFVELFGTPEQGIAEADDYRPPCAKTFADAMRAGHQQMITTVAVRAFFGSHFATPPETRNAHRRFLEQTLPSELSAVTYTAARRSDADG